MGTKAIESFPIVIPGGGAVAGYAAKELAAQSGTKADLAIVTAENALPLTSTQIKEKKDLS
jgi:chaperonin GroEL (HSP60 family)